jgi:hypothetical protein
MKYQGISISANDSIRKLINDVFMVAQINYKNNIYHTKHIIIITITNNLI